MKPILTLAICAVAVQLFAQQWTTAELSEARWDANMVAIGNYVVIGGGAQGQETKFSKRVDIYNALTGEWKVDSLSSPRYTGAIAAAGDKVIFAGGWDDASLSPPLPTRTIDIYDVMTGEWKLDTLPYGPRCLWRGIGVGKKAYFMGGFNSPDTPLDSVLIYDTEMAEWSVGEPMPWVAGLSSIIAFDKKIMQKRSAVWGIYDTETDSWTSGVFPSLTPAQQSPVLLGNKIYMAGGYDLNTNEGYANLLIYDIPTNTWTEETLAVARACGMAGTVNGKLIIAGGSATYDLVPGAVSAGLVEIYDTLTATWNYEFSLSQPRAFMDYQRTAPVIGNQIFFPGGDTSGDGQQSSRVDIFTDTSAVSDSHFIPKLPETALQLSPVPCRSSLNAQLQLPTGTTEASIIIFDQQGRELARQKIMAGQDGLSLKFDTSTWNPGHYLAVLWTAQGVRAERLVKVD